MDSNPSPSSHLHPDELRETLLEQIRVKQRLLEIARTSGLLAYRPHPKQDAFHRSTAKRRAFFAGNRCGKSTASCAETLAWALGERVWYNKADPARKSGIPPYATKQLIVTTDWDKVDEIWTGQRGDRPGKIWQMAPQGSIVGQKRNHSGAIETLEFANGSLVRFDTVESFKKNPQGSESSDWDRVAFDEPGPEGMWKANSRGLIDRHGQGDFTLTPLSELWIFDYFYESGARGRTEKLLDGRFAIRASIYDNPFLTREAIAEFERDLTEDEKQCRLYGIPLELAGLVYKEFRYEQHVLDSLPLGWADYHLPPKNYILDVRIDPHPQTPNAVLFCATGPEQVPILCHEIWSPCDAHSLADQIIAYTRSTGCYVNSIKCDPSAWVTDQIRKARAAVDLFADRGLFVTPASKDLINGILVTRSVLKKPNGIKFSPNLRRTLWEISRYCYDKENKPIDRDDHMMENLRRLTLDSPTWFDPDRAAGRSVPEEDFDKRDLTPVD